MEQLPLFEIENFYQPHPMIKTMENLRLRFSVLQNTLIQLGYEFESPDQVLGTPDPDLDDKLGFLTREFGSVPKALVYFYKIIGSLNFLGSHPNWSGCKYPDPVFVCSIDAVMDDLKVWHQEVGKFGLENTGEFRVPIAPDYFHKEKVSGGMFYNVILPNTLSDPPLEDEWHRTTFLGYLQICLKWGGFPGLEKSGNHAWPLGSLQKATVIR